LVTAISTIFLQMNCHEGLKQAVFYNYYLTGSTGLSRFFDRITFQKNVIQFIYLAAHSLRSLDRRRRRQKPQSLRDTINAYA